MRVIALDTSTQITTCALLEVASFAGDRAEPRSGGALEAEHRVIWEKEVPGRAGDVLPDALGDPRDFDAIAVGLGPGSFTGLRVGLAAAKALSYARRLPIAGASSLHAIALDRKGQVHAATDARKGELFVQKFENGHPDGPVRIVMAADFPEKPLLIAPPARNVARLCLPRLRGAAYDVQACFALAPDYVQGFPR
ncbi:MAG: tRNA (adenosine(37)-N6)-threonylcarbamoyltransferase complex dimerization subunit type 1 TsaB [Myxococcales bacterium]|nr:tRNA (adenosine(37)-N6)-threonylcarbamoyltransferase complex dimerization subunit type 1 TsaB [Myxococcales bacterium]